MLLLNFWDDVSLAVLILVVFSLYNTLKKGWAPSPTIALVTTLIITLLILVPYVWVRYLAFVVLILGGSLGTLADSWRKK